MTRRRVRNLVNDLGRLGDEELAHVTAIARANIRTLTLAYNLARSTADDLAHARTLKHARVRGHDILRALNHLERSNGGPGPCNIQSYADGDDDFRLSPISISPRLPLPSGNAQDLADALSRVSTLADAQDLAHALAARLQRACKVTGLILEQLEPIEQSRKTVAGAAVAPARSARRLAGFAVQVLPAGHQTRYGEEFGAELYDLAAAGSSRWRQLAYALRLLDRAWVLRAELREARRQVAS
jgi:hypothetical protein